MKYWLRWLCLGTMAVLCCVWLARSNPVRAKDLTGPRYSAEELDPALYCDPSAAREDYPTWVQVDLKVDDSGYVTLHRTFSDGTEEETHYPTRTESRPGRLPVSATYTVQLGRGNSQPPAECVVQYAGSEEYLSLFVEMVGQAEESLREAESHAPESPAPEALGRSGPEEREYRKNLTYYSSDDRPLWSIETDSFFQGERYREGHGAVTVYDDAWQSQELCFAGWGGKDRDYRGETKCVMVRQVLGIPVARLEVSMWIDSRGRCQVEIRNVSLFRPDRKERLEL